MNLYSLPDIKRKRLHMSDATASESYLSLSNFYNLRFGHCKNSAEGDFIDNIDGRFNLYVASGYDDFENEYTITFHKGKLRVSQHTTFHDCIETIADDMTDLIPANIAKALIQSGHDQDPDGFIDFAPEYEKCYFDAREDDDVSNFAPCFFVVSSVTYDCAAKIDVSDGSVTFAGERVSSLSEFYGHVDEDNWYVVGVTGHEGL